MKTKYRILKDGNGNFQVKYKLAWFLPWNLEIVGPVLSGTKGNINYGRKWDAPRLFKWLEDAEAWVAEDKAYREKKLEHYYQKRQNKKLEKKLEKVKEY